ncbi:MAG TPA: phosphatidylserine decarboxylase family protein [Saprospiraceae bacterium]|nr:phosphatidylserine decarboxylase family protein [Saprospiraceae bacterium]
MRFHNEGKRIILTVIAVMILAAGFLFYYTGRNTATFIFIFILFILIFVLQFFRNPLRPLKNFTPYDVNCPADGKVVIVEEMEEGEYFHDKRLQVSIFMSPINVHVNRNPVSGTIAYFKYHPGKYLVAWAPKSSEINERTTVVYDTGLHQIMLKQIAGALARRIVSYVSLNDKVKAGEDMGFIKFGSRVDVILPMDAEILVKPGQYVKGNKDIIARLKIEKDA